MPATAADGDVRTDDSSCAASGDAQPTSTQQVPTASAQPVMRARGPPWGRAEERAEMCFMESSSPAAGTRRPWATD
jgi:hypothetical protein